MFVYTSRRYGEAYENFGIDPAPCWKNPLKHNLAIPKCQPLLVGENYTEIKGYS